MNFFSDKIYFVRRTAESLVWRIKIKSQRERILKAVASLNKKEELRIAVFHQGGIGSGLMLGPMLQLLKKMRPKAVVTLFSWQEPEGQLLKAAKLVTHFKVLYPKSIEKSAEGHYDFLFSAAHTFEGDKAAHRISAAVKVGFKHQVGWDKESFLYHHLTADIVTKKHEVLWDIQLLEPVFGHLPPLSAYLLPDEFLNKVDRDKQPDFSNYVAVHPGGGRRMSWKRYSLEKMAHAARLVRDSLDVQIVVIAGPDEKIQAQQLVDDVGDRASIYNTSESLVESLKVVRRARCLITNDSMLMHLGACARAPIVLITGPTDPYVSGPWCEPQLLKIVREPLYCSPCYQLYSGNLCCVNPRYLECLDLVKPEQILMAVQSLVEEKNRDIF